jgi:hypothetical protein
MEVTSGKNHRQKKITPMLSMELNARITKICNSLVVFSHFLHFSIVRMVRINVSSIEMHA